MVFSIFAIACGLLYMQMSRACSFSDINEVIRNVNPFLKTLHTWTVNNTLKINVGKTRAVTFRSRNSHCFPIEPLFLEIFHINMGKSPKSLRDVVNEFLS